MKTENEKKATLFEYLILEHWPLLIFGILLFSIMLPLIFERISEGQTFSISEIIFESISSADKTFNPEPNMMNYDYVTTMTMVKFLGLAALFVYAVEKLLNFFKITIKDTQAYNLTKFNHFCGFFILIFLKFITPTKKTFLISFAFFISLLLVLNNFNLSNIYLVENGRIMLALLTTALLYIFLMPSAHGQNKTDRVDEIEKRMEELREEFEIVLNE